MAKRGTLSISKARKLLKYKPKFDLSRGFEDIINGIKKFMQQNKIETKSSDLKEKNFFQ